MLLLILFIISLCEADPLPCPVPQDRENATYNGGLCFRSYSCCFRELIVEKPKHHSVVMRMVRKVLINVVVELLTVLVLYSLLY